MRISFLLHNAYGIGGTIRTTFTLAEALAERHEVEIVSVFRHRETPRMGAPKGVGLRALVELRKDSPEYAAGDPEHARPARVFPRGDGRHRQYSRLTDARIGAHLRSLDADVVVGTRPGLNVHIARQAPRGTVRVGQEHLTLDGHGYRLRRELGYRYARLDAITTVTEADARSYRTRLRLPGVRIDAVPNGVPSPAVAPADGRAKFVVAAGRLTRVKRFDLLVEAFAKVVAARPDWRLRIYGGGDATGDEHAALTRLIADRDLGDHVFLMGNVHPLEPEWVKGSIAAVTSTKEAFGMTIVEAMRCGLPVVATDCPNGPREIIEDGVDGRLVPVGDADAVAAALLELIGDDERRRRAGAAALAASGRFDPAAIAARHEAVFTELLARAGARGPGGALRDLAYRLRGGCYGSYYALRHLAATALRRVRAR
ncbi:glycosyltransferase [Streptomyces qinzhouensis]|uniref:D-inositol 3-phosphate glycosyltransferase n=1 Tax=Streptomyces qinzhouensis TaxID=2599401 RepID=A0A5B8J4B8_9ACTN|nr:glycosyltransferase [Streptomyces qinzhouensis]QDY76066.1 glycosyltransferase family 4 protein [Streptomyces qinzhouensis]